ncbi:MAG: cytochrome P450 [Nitrospira sp.]|nr:cytochrome P450 [Nitrospira sp.]MCP9463529.1 cytochrome P450 [Nitrospira sp.]
MSDSGSSFELVDVPGGLPLFGHAGIFKNNPLRTMAEWWRRHGDALRFRLGPKTLHLFSHPTLAEEVLVRQADRFVKVYDPRQPVGLALVLGNGLVTSSGEVWRRHRRIIQPIFHRARLTAMADRMVQIGERRIAGWSEQLEHPFDVAAEMMVLTLEVISHTMFTTSVAQHIEQISHALRVSLRYAFDSFHNPLHPPTWLPTRRNREFQEVTAFLDRLIYALIAERRQSGRRYNDLLDRLLEARDEETGAGLTDQELRDEALTIFAAGHETTANALAWTWYLLATHPAVKARFHEELDRVLQGKRPTVDDLPNLPYTRALFDESLRLFPPAPAIQRKAATDTRVGGLSLPAGSVVLIGTYNLHRHPEFWSEPDRFAPERWLSDHQLPARCAYLPFGAGPRACVGTHFALIEGPLLLALIGQCYDLRLAQERVEPQLMVTLRPKDGILMTRHPRLKAAISTASR